MFGECVHMIVHALTTGLCILDCSYNLADTTGSSQHESFTTDKNSMYNLPFGLWIVSFVKIWNDKVIQIWSLDVMSSLVESNSRAYC